MKGYEFGGGPVDRSRSIYVLRDADKKVPALLARHEFVNVVAPRQTGKTSLCYGAMADLTADYQIVRLDVRTVFGQVHDAQAWFDEFYRQVVEQCQLDLNDLKAWLDQETHGSLVRRTTAFFESFLIPQLTRPLILAIDELDYLQVYEAHTDQLLFALRSLHENRRNLRLSVLLLGIARPGELLKTTGASAYNVGSFIDLPDFESDSGTIKAWASGLNVSDNERSAVMTAILRQSGGQPYLTATLCHEFNQNELRDAVDANSLANAIVDDVANNRRSMSHFAGPADILIERPNLAYEALQAYHRVLEGEAVSWADIMPPVATVLRIAGLLREEQGKLHIKGDMYRRYFDQKWVDSVNTQLRQRTYTEVVAVEPAFNKRVCVINIGGTIGMETGSTGSMVPPADLMQFYRRYSEINKIARIEPVPLLTKDGANIFPEDWETLAATIYGMRTKGFDGIVVAGGTDTLAYTASAVAFALGQALNFPVVFTGAQAPIKVPYGDARVNLIRACLVATLDIKEVVISFDDQVLRAVRAEKKDDYRFDGFHSPSYRPLAIIAERVEIQRELLRKPLGAYVQRIDPGQTLFARNVWQIVQYPGLEPELYVKMLDSDKPQGIVIQTLGIGNLPTMGRYSFQRLIEQATRRGIPVLLTSRYPIQPEFVGQYVPASEALSWGAIQAGNMTPTAALTKFMWVIPQVDKAITERQLLPEKRMQEIARLMGEDYVGEIDRIEKREMTPYK